MKTETISLEISAFDNAADRSACKECESSAYLEYTFQTFSNGKIHIRCDCSRCGIFAGYRKQKIDVNKSKQKRECRSYLEG